MVDILPKIPSFGEKFAASLFGGLSKGYEQGSDFAQKMALQKQKLESQQKEGEMEKFALALDTLGQMRQLLGKGTIGTTFGVGINPFRHMGESGHDREQFAHYGRSLIPLVAAGIPVKNRNEFEEYKKIITNPDATIGQLEGAIDGLEHLFSKKAFGIEHERDELETPKSKKDFNIIQTPDGKKVKVPYARVKEAVKMGGKIIE